MAWGVEGAGCYGAGLARFLAAQRQAVLEVNPARPRPRRRKGSPIRGRPAAAGAVQAGTQRRSPRPHGQVEMIRSMRVAPQTAMRSRTQAINALRALLVTAPPTP